MEAGKHVVLEKPMALSLEDADRIITTAKATGVKLCVVLQNRYNPPMQDLRRVVDEGRLGRLILGNATVRWYRPQEYYEDGWHGTWAMDGGALMNQSIHHIDALQWLMGDVQSVFAYTATLAHKMEAEDTGVAVLRFANGAIGSVEGSTVTYPGEPGRFGGALRRMRFGESGRNGPQSQDLLEDRGRSRARARAADPGTGRSAFCLWAESQGGDRRHDRGHPGKLPAAYERGRSP